MLYMFLAPTPAPTPAPSAIPTQNAPGGSGNVGAGGNTISKFVFGAYHYCVPTWLSFYAISGCQTGYLHIAA